MVLSRLRRALGENALIIAKKNSWQETGPVLSKVSRMVLLSRTAARVTRDAARACEQTGDRVHLLALRDNTTAPLATKIQRILSVIERLQRISEQKCSMYSAFWDNGKAIRLVCREFVMLCRKLDLFSDAFVAIDGSKFKAVNNRDRNRTFDDLHAFCERETFALAELRRALA